MRVGLEAAAALALLATGCGLGRTAFTVDSVEDGRAVLVGKEGEVVTATVPELPPGAREGDVFVDGRADEEARLRLLFEIRERRGRLLQKSGPGGDLNLEAP